MNSTPVPQSSPRLPNTIDWTFTAVPQENDLERVALGPVKRFQLEDDVPVHRYEPAAAVPGEARVLLIPDI